MTILNIQVATIGETGVVPKFIYINTDDTYIEVEETGYLNGVVAQGQSISNTDMALVVTRVTPDTRMPTTAFYQVAYSDGNWSLLPLSVGIPFIPSADYTLTGSWNFQGPFNVQAGSGDVVLQSDTGDIALLAPNAGSTANVTADNVIVQGNTALTLQAASIYLPLLVSGSQLANIIYYDDSTGQINYATISTGFDTAADYSTSGTWTNSGGWTFTGSFEINNTSDIDVTSTGNYLQTTAGLSLNTPNGFDMMLNCGQNMTQSATGNFNINANAGIFTLTSVTTIIDSAFQLPTIPNNSNSNILYIDPTTFAVSYDTPPTGFDPTANYNTSGDWNNSGSWTYTGPFEINNTSNINVTTTGNYVQSSGGLSLVTLTGTDILFNCGQNLNFNAANDVNFLASAGVITLSATTVGQSVTITTPLTVINSAVQLPTIPNSSNSNVVYIDPSTFALSYAPAATSGISSWVTVSGTTQAMTANIGYFSTNNALTTFNLPASPTIGQMFAVSGLGTGFWTIKANTGQIVHFATSSTAAAGTVTSTHRYDSIMILCSVAGASAEYVCIASVGSAFTVV